MTLIFNARSAPSARLGLALIVLASLLLAASTWRVYSHTWDEPEHLAAGLELLDRGRYEYDIEHPPLARALIAIGPYLAGARSYGTAPPDGVQEGIDILYGTGHYDLYLTLARLGALPFLALLLFAAWLWARRVARSDGEALLAVLMLASVPPILGHAALATLDVPGAATTLLALYLLQGWIMSGSRREAILAGVATGVALATKLFAVPFLGLGALASLAIRAVARSSDDALQPDTQVGRSGRLGRRAAGVALLMVAIAVPLVVAYGHRSIGWTREPPRFTGLLASLFHGRGWTHTAYADILHLRLPEVFWDFAAGIATLKAHNDAGHLSFLLGELRSGGWWYFYLLALAVKTPLPLLLTGPPGMVLMARDGWCERNPWRMAPAVLFVTLLTFASLYSRINIGIRHVLILYPFVALGGAYLLAWAWRSLGALQDPKHIGLALCIIVGLVAWQVSTLWTANPDYLPYFNKAVTHPEDLLVDSDLDWGQDLRRLEWRLSELKVPHLSLAYLGTADLSREPLPPMNLLPPRQRVTGWVAITALAREHEPIGYAWLSAYKPVQRVGKTIDLYYIP
jgi:Dolichyl-phosphate-mannose-protein mannosyltransferase